MPAEQVGALVEVNEAARIDALRLSLSVLAVLAAVATFLTRMLPVTPAGHREDEEQPTTAS